ncbi:MAG: hypothetical protein HY774_26540, partial [Acidobacteria bacterium]|nr:hypothetical protein [Acidobacteriota bacterium]
MSKLFRLLLCVLLVAGMGGLWLRQGSASTSLTTDKQAAGLEIPTTEAMDLWQDVDVATLRAVQQQEVNWINPLEYRSVALNELSLAGILNQAPMEFSAESMSSRVVMTFPMPDGTNQRFAIVESPIMGPELAAEWSHIKTYAGQGIDDPTATIRFDVSPVGLRGMILSAEDTVYIDPAKRGGTNLYMTYSKSKYVREDKAFDCEMTSPELGDLDQHDHKFSVTPNTLPTENPIRLRTYRLVVCGNAEYGNAAGGGVLANAQAAVVTTVNRVSGLYERDMAVRLSLVKSYVFVGSTTADPFTNSANTSATTAWSENTTYINNNWGAANYDAGHFFSTGAGGAGDIGQVCVAGRKANGATGQSAPTGDGYDIDYVAHELGHQFGGRHTFNSGGTNGCNAGARDTTGPLPNAIEPGSGSTVMAYASICGSQDLQLIGQGEGANGQVIAGASDDYFHSTSVERIINNVTSGTSTCGAQTVTTNNRPTVDAGLNYTIPVNTPFTLTAASASDPDGDALTYCWEQMDQGSAITSGSLPNPDLGNNAIFRSWQPSTSSSRIFPERSVILNDSTKESRPGRHAKSLKGEKLPTTSRTMNFRCTVRDNRAGGGGVSWDAMTVTTTTGAGPFAVSAPNTNVSWANNTSQTVTWSVANTSASPVSCANVKISLSTDGGVTFPTVLLATTPNDGTQAVTIPSGITSTTARIKVEAVGNIFFDISNTNFTITAGSSCTFSVSPTTVSATAAGGASSVSVTAGTGCAWTATSNASWITTSASGSGNGTASFTVAANSTTSTRTGTLTVAGQTVTVNQAAGTSTCTYTVSPTTVSATAAGGASSVSVTAGTGCAWTATSNASWITTSASGSGNGTASFTVAANSGTTSRTGTLTVAGQTVTVTQAGNTGSQTVTGSNTSAIAIPDNNTTGVTRVINIATALTIQ